MDLKDQSGEMSATFFGRAVDKYYNMLKCGQARLQSCFVVVDYLYLWQPPKKDRKVSYACPYLDFSMMIMLAFFKNTFLPFVRVNMEDALPRMLNTRHRAKP